MWGVERGAETSLEMLGVGFNTMLPGEAQRSRGTGVCNRARKGIFRQKELRSTAWEQSGHRTGAGCGLGGRTRTSESQSVPKLRDGGQGEPCDWLPIKIRVIGSGRQLTAQQPMP